MAMVETPINENIHYLTTLKQITQRTTTCTEWLGVGVRTCIEVKHPKIGKRTHKTCTQAQIYNT